MTATLLTPSANGAAGAGAVAQRAMLVDQTIRRWSAVRKDKRIAGEANKVYRSREDKTRGSKDLLWGAELDAVNTLLNAAYKDHIHRTLPWADAGGRALSSAGYFDYCGAMRAFEAQLGPALDTLAGSFGRMMAEAAQDAPYGLGDLFDPSQYPRDGYELAGRFSLAVEYSPLPTADDFRVALGDAELARVRGEYAAAFNARMDVAVSDVVGRIRETVGHMAEALRAYSEREEGKGRAGAFRDTLVENVRSLVAVLPSLNLTGDAGIADVCSRMAAELCAVGPETLRASAAERVRVAESAESILETMSAYV